MKRLYTDDNIDELEANIKDFIDTCIEGDEVPGFAIAAYHLGFSSRQSLYEYTKHKDKTSLPIKRLLLFIEASYEHALRKQSCTGAIFALKNRGWTDKSEVEHSGGIEYIIVSAEADEQ